MKRIEPLRLEDVWATRIQDGKDIDIITKEPLSLGMVVNKINALIAAHNSAIEDKPHVCTCVYESDCHGIEMIKSPNGYGVG